MTLVDLALMVITSPASYMATRDACGPQVSASDSLANSADGQQVSDCCCIYHITATQKLA